MQMDRPCHHRPGGLAFVLVSDPLAAEEDSVSGTRWREEDGCSWCLQMMGLSRVKPLLLYSLISRIYVIVRLSVYYLTIYLLDYLVTTLRDGKSP